MFSCESHISHYVSPMKPGINMEKSCPCMILHSCIRVPSEEKQQQNDDIDPWLMAATLATYDLLNVTVVDKKFTPFHQYQIRQFVYN